MVITGVDVGMYAASQVNANHFENLQFIGVGSASYWFEINSENTIVGGFTGGSFPGIPWPIVNGEVTHLSSGRLTSVFDARLVHTQSICWNFV